MLKADLTTILGHCHVIWETELPGTLWAPRACNGTDFLFFFFNLHLEAEQFNTAFVLIKGKVIPITGLCGPEGG